MQLIQNGIVNLACVHIHSVVHMFGASSVNTLALSTLLLPYQENFITAKWLRLSV